MPPSPPQSLVWMIPEPFPPSAQMQDIVKAVGSCSYNQLVEKIISCKQSENSELAGEGELPQVLRSDVSSL